MVGDEWAWTLAYGYLYVLLLTPVSINRLSTLYAIVTEVTAASEEKDKRLMIWIASPCVLLVTAACRESSHTRFTQSLLCDDAQIMLGGVMLC